jgi:hypothetical protein
MQGEKSKECLLKNKGFKYNFYRMIYFSVEQKKVFSREYVEDKPIQTIDKNISEKSEKWEFYFNMPMSEQVKEQLLSELIDAR